MIAIIALGSNLGDRQLNLKRGINALGAFGTVTVSPCWLETPDESGLGPSYINTVAILDTSVASPTTLLESMLRIELRLGRDRSNSRSRNAPRPLDLDLIAVERMSGFWRWTTPNDLIILGTELTLELPHPRASRRPFVMQPLQALNLPSF